MKRILFFLLLFVCLSATDSPLFAQTATAGVSFHSTDKQLEATFLWAKKMAMSYVHDDSDPVGFWYEAALPQREAFCMRDVSHQSVGAEILGLSRHNKNMMTRFVENISESRDWCTYWEINRYNKPAPVDYKNDEEFWYNLNANFDVLQACLKMYEWTGDNYYLKDKRFVNFYEKTLNEYVERWQLAPENIMQRPRFMNKPGGFDPKNNFHTCRGLASYVENFQGLAVGVDLISTLYSAYTSHAKMAMLDGDKKTARMDKLKAVAYQTLLEKEWWDADSSYYQTFWTEEQKFHRGEGIPFLLWFDAIRQPERKRASVKDILSKNWNVENLSAFPALLYRLGYFQDAYRVMSQLPTIERAEYPEVSFGVIEGVVCGSMGIVPTAEDGTIKTCAKLTDSNTDTEIRNLPVFGGHINVSHTGTTASRMENHTGRAITWHVSFVGSHAKVEAGGKTIKTKKMKDLYGNTISTAKVSLKDGESMTVKAVI